MPFSPAAKRAIELAVEEAVAHRDEDIGTAHLLFSLLSDERENAASMAVAQAGFDRTRVRQAVHETLASGASDSD